MNVLPTLDPLMNRNKNLKRIQPPPPPPPPTYTHSHPHPHTHIHSHIHTHTHPHLWQKQTNKQSQRHGNSSNRFAPSHYNSKLARRTVQASKTLEALCPLSCLWNQLSTISSLCWYPKSTLCTKHFHEQKTKISNKNNNKPTTTNRKTTTTTTTTGIKAQWRAAG